MEEKMTLVERLRNPQYFMESASTGSLATMGTAVSRLDETAALATMREAADEIERLQRLAGAVTQGESFRDIREQTKRPTGFGETAIP